ncbi:MAG TPA: M1 family peptidase, partial [Sedimenticola sp.]|nr:M1 family peptidase [Sedimenticola sp.]
MGYRRWKCHLISIAYLLLPALVQAGPPRPPLHHELQVRLDPAANTLQASDRITFPAPRSRFDFLLHAGLKPELKGPGATLAPGERVAGPVPLRRWRVRFEPPSKRLDLTYRGRINQPFATLSQGYAGGRRTTAGTISSKGVFLAGSSYWYPRPTGEDAMLTFSLATGLPDGWLAVSQGRRGADGRSWEETAPQDEIYLVAGPFHRYARRGPVAEAAVYLRDPDPALARRYLAATDRYLSLYDRLIGPYPYAKFALVENFWESGYGMPSFTLLGPRVIRLPFILHSSYPHEILHNWWGNGVYVDYATGNWSEGMTSYFADHLIREQQGKGAEYRRDTLQRYADFVARDEDFPLRAFRGNRGEVSQAVGYGKMLMFLHMLRRQLGDRAFLAGIRRFYRDNRFRVAGFDDLRKALEQAAGTGLGAMFRQWTGRAGAPALALEELRVERDGTGYRVRGRLRQTQAGAPFRLQVPLFLQLAGEPVAQSHPVEMEGREASLDIRIDRRPLRLAVDPRFDLFRRLAPGETPPSLGRLFGARGVTILLPR